VHLDAPSFSPIPGAMSRSDENRPGIGRDFVWGKGFYLKRARGLNP